MNKFKRFYSLLCFLLMFCVGFLSIDSFTVYAYEQEDNFYPLVSPNSKLKTYGDNYTPERFYSLSGITDNKHKFSNPYLENVFLISWVTDTDFSNLTFPYNPDIYDYYMLGNLVAENTDVTKSTFKPTELVIYAQDYGTNKEEYYFLNNVQFYDIDTTKYSGFGWSAKVEFSGRDNIGITSVDFKKDKDGLGNKPANLVLEAGILAVEKSGSETAVLSQILNQLKLMEESITENIQNAGNNISGAVGQAGEKVSGAVNEAGDKIANKLEEQYQMDESEDFGVGDITDEVEEKLGVLTVGTDTLIGFLDLFDASNAGSTTITFPAFKIDVQGQSYNVWNDIQYDLSTLEDDFGILIDSVRTVLVLCVWLAVLSYLVKAKDHFINGGG